MHKTIKYLTILIFIICIHPSQAQSVYKLAAQIYPEGIQKIESWSYYDVKYQNNKPSINEATPTYQEYYFKKGNLASIIGYSENKDIAEALYFHWQNNNIHEIRKCDWSSGKKKTINRFAYNNEGNFIKERIIDEYSSNVGKNKIKTSQDSKGNKVLTIEYYHKYAETPYQTEIRVSNKKQNLLSRTIFSPTDTLSKFRMTKTIGDTIEMGEFKRFTNNKVSYVSNVIVKSKYDTHGQILSIVTTSKWKNYENGQNGSGTDIHLYKNHYTSGEVHSHSYDNKLTLEEGSYINIRDNIKVDFSGNGQCTVSVYNPKKKENPYAVALAGDWTYDLLSQKNCLVQEDKLKCENLEAKIVFRNSDIILLRREGLEDIELEILK